MVTLRESTKCSRSRLYHARSHAADWYDPDSVDESKMAPLHSGIQPRLKHIAVFLGIELRGLGQNLASACLA
jgi:hypothetical protein